MKRCAVLRQQLDRLDWQPSCVASAAERRIAAGLPPAGV